MTTIQVGERGRITLPEEILATYRLDVGSRLLITPLDSERFEVRVVPVRRSILALMDLYTTEREAPDIAAEREALGDALDEAFRTGGPRP